MLICWDMVPCIAVDTCFRTSFCLYHPSDEYADNGGKLHGAISQRTDILMFIAEKTSYLNSLNTGKLTFFTFILVLRILS